MTFPRASAIPRSRRGDGIDLAVARAAIDTVLAAFVREKAASAADHFLPTEVTDLLAAFLAAGGKRLRPLLCITGWHVAAPTPTTAPTPDAVIRAAAALEMFHAFCLIHDDVMDQSAVRRGRPALHRTLTARRAHNGERAASRTAESCAILIGDLALCWSGELLHTSGLAPAQLPAALAVVDSMRTEVMCGQYLDVTHPPIPPPGVCDDGAGVEAALRTIRYKSAKYTVERPLHLGAVLAGAPSPLLDALSAFAIPLGEAFQLRDDLHGVFGDPSVTGKPSLDDLREGKHTVLLALGRLHAPPADRDTLATLVGNPELDEADADRIRVILTAAGARGEVERMIAKRRAQALSALAELPAAAAARAALRVLVDAATHTR